MGLNVFGTPITVDTVKEMPEYHESKMIYSADCATVALEMKNAEGKDISARSFLEYMEPRFGLGVSTMCMIYNATGHPLTLVDTHSWEGRICETPYPMVILNGQWGAFLHGQYHNGAASEACVVYNGLNFDWVLSFTNSNSNTNTKTNRVVTLSLSFNSHFDLRFCYIYRILNFTFLYLFLLPYFIKRYTSYK